MTESERKFPYGGNEICGVECPASRAGFNPSEMWEKNRWYGRIADQYDLYVAMELYERDGGDPGDPEEVPDPIHGTLRDMGYDKGVIGEELARKCWRDAWECQGAEEEGRTVERELEWSE